MKKQKKGEIQFLDPEYSQHNCEHDIEKMEQVVLREKITIQGETVERKMYCANCDKFLKSL